MKKIFIIWVILILFLLRTTSCMENRKTPQNINEIALLYMEQRYGIRFEYSEPWGNSLSGTREFLATSESLPNQQVFVQIENFRDDDRIFRSNFLAVKHEAETIYFLRNLTAQIFNEANVYYEAAHDGLSPSLPANATFYEFLADTCVPLNIMVEVRERSFTSREKVGALAELIAASGAHFHLTVVIVDDDLFGTMNRQALNWQISLRQFVYVASVTNRGLGMHIEWIGDE